MPLPDPRREALANVEDAAIPRVPLPAENLAGLHSLRHSHGSQLLSAGVPLPTVSKRLGHGSTHITAQIYAHAFTTDEQAAADIWDAAMRKAVEGEKARQ